MSSPKRLKMAHSQSSVNLTLSYTSPDNEPFQLSHSIEAPSDASTESKMRYLQKLREKITETQDEVNRILTEKMEEDKARLASGGGKAVVDDAKEEENYGEEVVEED